MKIMITGARGLLGRTLINVLGEHELLGADIGDFDITDPQGKSAEFSGWYAAPNGRLSLKLDIAPNDAIGNWTIQARELASGKSAQGTFLVR